MRRLFSTFGHGSPGAGSCRCARLPVSVLSSMASWYCALNRRWYPRYCTPSRPVLECPPFRVGELTRHGTTAAAAPSRAAGTIGVEPTAFSGARSVHACARICTLPVTSGARRPTLCGKPVDRTTDWRSEYRAPWRSSSGAGLTGVRLRQSRSATVAGDWAAYGWASLLSPT